MIAMKAMMAMIAMIDMIAIEGMVAMIVMVAIVAMMDSLLGVGITKFSFYLLGPSTAQSSVTTRPFGLRIEAN